MLFTLSASKQQQVVLIQLPRVKAAESTINIATSGQRTNFEGFGEPSIDETYIHAQLPETYIHAQKSQIKTYIHVEGLAFKHTWIRFPYGYFFL